MPSAKLSISLSYISSLLGRPVPSSSYYSLSSSFGGVSLLLEMCRSFPLSHLAHSDAEERLRGMAWSGVKEAYEQMEGGAEKARCFLEVYARRGEGEGGGRGEGEDRDVEYID